MRKIGMLVTAIVVMFAMLSCNISMSDTSNSSTVQTQAALACNKRW